MDPSSATTLERAAEAAFALVERLPLPPSLRLPVLGGLGAIVVALLIVRMVKSGKLKVEAAPPPVSDGGAAGDRELPPAVAGDGGPRTISDGGAAGDLGLPPAQQTQGEPGGGPGGGNG